VKIKRFRVTAIVACTPCTRARTRYIFSFDSAKCSEYTRKGVSYDGNFMEADFDKLSEEREKLEAARSLTITELASFNKWVETLKKTQGAIITQEARALEELKREEER
jgi:hypothetical protein